VTRVQVKLAPVRSLFLVAADAESRDYPRSNRSAETKRTISYSGGRHRGDHPRRFTVGTAACAARRRWAGAQSPPFGGRE